MNEPKYDKQSLTAYLLGSLSETETEFFDELSITDDDFALELKEVENELIDDYAAGRLTGVKLRQFEKSYLSNPDSKLKIKFAGTIQIYPEKAVSVSDSPEAVRLPPKTNPAPTFFSKLKIYLTPLKLAAAAGLLLVCGFVWLLLSRTNQSSEPEIAAVNSPAPNEIPTVSPAANSTLEAVPTQTPILKTENNKNTDKPVEKKNADSKPTPQPAQTPLQPKPVIAFFTLAPTLRDGAALTQFTLPKNAASARFQIKLGTDDFKFYQAVMQTAAGKTVWRSAKLKSQGAGSKSFLTTQIPAGLLSSNVYSFVISAIKDDGSTEIIGNYAFKISN